MRINQFENAYGICKLDLSECKNKLDNVVIYASNGVFKTSFARALDQLRQGEAKRVKDRLTDKKFNCEIEHEGHQYTEKDQFENVIVYSPELYENKNLIEGNYINKLVVLDKQKEELFEINKSVQAIESQIKDFLQNELKLKPNEVFEVIESQLGSQFDNRFDCLIYLYEYLIEHEQHLEYDISFINRKNFSQKSYEKAIDDEFKDLAKAYSSVVNQKFEELFDQNFNITNADDFLTTLKETQFLSEHRKIKVGDDKEFKDYNEFEGYVEEVKAKVYQDEEVVKAFEKLEKKLNQTASSHDIREIVKKGNERQIEILSLGRNHLYLIMYGQSIGLENIKETLSNLKKIKNEATMIFNHAKDQKTHFEHALSIYEERFDPSFHIRIDNHIGSFLGMETPEFVFEYKYPKNQEVPQHSEKEIKSMLSSGERTTLDILRFIVEYESKKASKPVIIIDDIVETFDYANRSGMLAYIDDIKNQGSNLIILTHNFDFFRLVSSRIDGMNKAIATKDENNVVNISKFDGPIFLKDFVKNAENSYDAIALIPLAREITVLKNDQNSHEYRKFFNNLLHIKKEGKDIFMHEVIEKVAQELTKNETKMKNVFDIQELESSYYQYMLEKHCKERPQGDLLSYKMFLAIQSRLLLEDLLINGDDKMLEKISKNQTRELINERKEQNVLSDTALSLCRRVQLYSPEFIHFNAFMYEPLIDVCPKQLEKLVKDLFEIQPDEFYLKEYL